MSVQFAGGAYISNEEYLVWMAEHTAEMYEQMGDAMEVSSESVAIQQELTSIKAKLAQLPNGSDAAGADWATVRREVEQLLSTHADHPAAPELRALLEPMIESIESAGKRSVEFIQAASSAITDGPDGLIGAARGVIEAGETLELGLDVVPSKDAVANWTEQMQGVIDKFGKDDQMALLNIQNLNARIQQATQLASNLISSANQAASSIVHNIKG
jgi:hypothetical protein